MIYLLAYYALGLVVSSLFVWRADSAELSENLRHLKLLKGRPMRQLEFILVSAILWPGLMGEFLDLFKGKK